MHELARIDFMENEETDILYKKLSYDVVGAAMEVHKELGGGFLEAVYHEALCKELKQKNIPFESEKELRIIYKNELLEKTYKADIVVDNKIILELKAISAITNVEEAQILNYLKCTGLRLGLLLNFRGPSLEWKRLVL